ncbi:uncharacterized protein LAJ45_11059 [Morchella importuna]|uniref:uncharacterized protein n=1 Tax=Morchella importuna TaxID=1174673 RepID=UPI001E8E99A7|nr:uncharacterized protein LAJ45_11059 [Morchella importuna]KAH8144938.1 hypothetical protein LAJ45_11059 [Morchella importuna]
MPVKSFDAWIVTQSKSETLPLSALKDSVLGIEADHYLQKLLTTTPSKEPLVVALGGFPFNLRNTVEADIDDLRKAGVKPIFVFKGFKTVPIEAPFSVNDEGPAQRSRAWELYDRGLANEAVEAFGIAGTLEPWEIYRYFQRILLENDVDFQVAPYAAWPQMQYLQKQGFVDAIWGNSELFMFEVEKVITHINITPGSTFTWINRPRLLQDMSLMNDMFVDACLLSGSDLCRPFPGVEGQAVAAAHAFLTSIDLIKRYRNISTVLNTNAGAGTTGYIDKYRKARASVRHHVIFTEDGVAEPLRSKEAPGDVHEFIGQRLPEELYFYLSRGVIGPQVVDMLATGELVIVAPFDNGDAEEYRKFLDALDPLRLQTLSLLAQPLHRWWTSSAVSVYYWFDKKATKKLVPKDVVATPYLATKSWNVKESFLRPELERAHKSVGLSFALTSLTDPIFAAKTITKNVKKDDGKKNDTKKEDVRRDDIKFLKTQDEIKLNTLWSMLQLRDFIDGEEHKLTPWGRGLQAAMAELDTPELDESIYIGMELLRFKVLKEVNFAPTLSGAPSRDEDKTHTTLISRVASIVPINHKSIGYTGPLSRNLLGFNSFIRTLTRNLRNMVEMVLVSLLMNGDAERDRGDLTELGLRLPFIDEVSAGLGIAVKTYLDELSNEPEPTTEEAKQRQKEKLPKMFAQAVDIVADVALAFKVWDAMVVGVKVLQKEGVLGEEANAFLAADKWLSGRR